MPANRPQVMSGRILIVEDNEVNQAVAAGILKNLGYRQIDTANDGRQALDKSGHTTYDLILMDMQMPVMDGYQATTELRQREAESAAGRDGAPALHTPVIALTANAMEGDRERCLAAGADDYLSKPFTPLELQNVLEKWLPYSPVDEVSGAEPLEDIGTATRDAGSGPAVAGDTGTPEQAGNEDSSPVDTSALDVIRDMQDEDDPDMLSDIIGLYFKGADDMLDTLQQAIAGKDAEAMRIAAHTLKSSSANMGARQLADLCREMEELGRAGSLDGSVDLLAGINREYQAVRAVLASELKDNVA